MADDHADVFVANKGELNLFELWIRQDLRESWYQNIKWHRQQNLTFGSINEIQKFTSLALKLSRISTVIIVLTRTRIK